MEYSAPEVFKNEIIKQYIAPAPKNTEAVQAEIKNLLPFLTPDKLSDDEMQRLKEPDTATDKEFNELMPTEKGGD